MEKRDDLRLIVCLRCQPRNKVASYRTPRVPNLPLVSHPAIGYDPCSSSSWHLNFSHQALSRYRVSILPGVPLQIRVRQRHASYAGPWHHKEQCKPLTIARLATRGCGVASSGQFFCKLPFHMILYLHGQPFYLHLHLLRIFSLINS
jgi:hypothetical protein